MPSTRLFYAPKAPPCELGCLWIKQCAQNGTACEEFNRYLYTDKLIDPPKDNPFESRADRDG